MNDYESENVRASRNAAHVSQTFDSIEGSRTATDDNHTRTAEFTSDERGDDRSGFVFFERLGCFSSNIYLAVLCDTSFETMQGRGSGSIL